ncbi:MAG TPA: PRC-barrel domain-containing protein [Noviherbaspirillum sp.]|uniref:PRC-barrel domain-containing protein n=1 Tax=Noviherbaspirillum sp. TaxID=1926288 RepID=UPI002D27E716|nr:PRC-barrel domain-containing protein [Noviherbaspirillum sp.]HYD94869.1 PRC-barrel domain-containing protein [Noviherbaspirillum sp.]
MTRLTAWALVASFTVFHSIHAGAQPAPATSAAAAAPAASQQQLRLYRGSQIIGSNVRDASGRKIGQIKDLILDARRGEIAYAALSFGGVTSTGNKFHPVPWTALEPGDDGSHYILRADRETISQAPGFDKRQWPDLADQAWHAEVERYWGRMVGRGTADTNRLSSGVSGASNPKADGAAASSGR